MLIPKKHDRSLMAEDLKKRDYGFLTVPVVF
jgi:hypothetical protein